jgi:hypothetical protein
VKHVIEEAAGRVLANAVVIGGDDDSLFVRTHSMLIQASSTGSGYTITVLDKPVLYVFNLLYILNFIFHKIL